MKAFVILAILAATLLTTCGPPAPPAATPTTPAVAEEPTTPPAPTPTPTSIPVAGTEELMREASSVWTYVPDAGHRLDSAAAAEVIGLPDGSVGLYVTKVCPGSTVAPNICFYRSADGLSFTYQTMSGIPPGAHDPTIVQLPSQRMRLYFVVTEQQSGGVGRNRVKSATSSDGVNWTLEDGVRLDDVSNAGVPEVIALPGGGFRLYYSAEERQRVPSTFIKSATSTDGLTFTIDAGDRTPAGWSGIGIVQTGPSDWLAVLARIEDTMPHNRIFLARSVNTLNWTIDPSPVIERGDGNTFDADIFSFRPGGLRIYYSFSPGCLGLGHDLICGVTGKQVPVVSGTLSLVTPTPESSPTPSPKP